MALLCGPFFSPVAEAVWVNMTPQQVKEALAYGKAGKEVAMAEFSREWTVSLGEKVGWATLYTPFHNLAYKARKAAVEKRELEEQETHKALDIKQPLSFSVTVLSDSLYYTRQRPSYLRYGDKVVPSVYEFIPDICENSNFFPDSPGYVAACVYKFPMKDIDPNSQVTLVVIKPEGEELHFPIDLSKMR